MPHELGAHLLTGPVFVEGALPGDVLEVEIQEVALRDDWGWIGGLPLLGTLPTSCPTPRSSARGSTASGWSRSCLGKELPLDPFFGIMAVARRRPGRRVTSNAPRAFGGTMDNQELKPGTMLDLPVFAEGALFSAGDGHARAG